MFASIRKYNVRRGSAEELARRVREGFVPMMRQIQGFRGYYLLDGGPDVLITISIFDSAESGNGAAVSCEAEGTTMFASIRKYNVRRFGGGTC